MTVVLPGFTLYHHGRPFQRHRLVFSRCNAPFLSSFISISIHIHLAKPAASSNTLVHAPRIRFHAAGGYLSSVQLVFKCRRTQKASLHSQPLSIRNWTHVQRSRKWHLTRLRKNITVLQPKDRRTARQGAFFPVQRELVFDIDMTDYDPIRTCCSAAAICKRCWGFISAAVQVLDTSIRDQFGYQHLLGVYSGRRGIHLWVADKEAMELTDDERRTMANWLTVVQGGKEPGKKVTVRIGSRALPPSLQ